MVFKSCNSLKNLNCDFNITNCSRVVFLNNMNTNQILWCKKRGIIENLKPNISKTLNICSFYAIIPSELILEFDSI